MKLRGDKLSWSRGTGENTHFAKQSRKKEQDNRVMTDPLADPESKAADHLATDYMEQAHIK